MLSVALYVPSLDRDGEPVPRDERMDCMDAVELTFAAHFGGFTTIRGRGGWIAHDQRLIVERIDVIRSFLPNDAQPTQARSIVVGAAQTVARIMNQSCVMVEFDGRPESIAAPAPQSIRESA